MGWIKYEARYEFPEGTFYILWDVGEETEYGYEIQLDFADNEGNLDGVGCWTFGYENWSRDVWLSWGGYIEELVMKMEGDQEALDLLLDDLDALDCCYLSYQPDEEVDDTMNHLEDLELIKLLIAETEEEEVA